LVEGEKAESGRPIAMPAPLTFHSEQTRVTVRLDVRTPQPVPTGAPTRSTGPHRLAFRSATVARLSRRRTGALGAAAISIFVIFILLGEGIPINGLASSSPPPPVAPTHPFAKSAPVAKVHSATPRGPSRSLCLLEALTLPGCPKIQGPNPSAGIEATSSPSGWSNVTPNPLPSSYPQQRFEAAMTYDPALSGDLLFGGVVASPSYEVTDDTWLYSGGVWTQLINASACGATLCPPARALAMMAYDPTDHQVLLFGGVPEYGVSGVALGDTWAYSNGAWVNLTATITGAPSPRLDGAMVFDTADNLDLLFGGQNAAGNTLGDTWVFAHDTWTNVTAGLTTAPDPRAGASIADSPNGYILLFGGEDNGNLSGNGCYAGGPYMGWWFENGHWAPMLYSPGCIPRPEGPAGALAASPAVTYGFPCGRTDAALAWSPGNHLFVLFGGFGATGAGCNSVFYSYLNDTWFDPTASGGMFTWLNTSAVGAPPARDAMGYVSDDSAGFFLVFGGYVGSGAANDVWRFYLPLSARFNGPATIQVNQINFDQFQMAAYGGTGDLIYQFHTQELKAGDTRELAGTGCDPFFGNSSYPVPSGGVALIDCSPAASSYNYFRITATVTDIGNITHPFITSNWTVEVIPQEKLKVWSQYGPDFYEGFSINNIFVLYAELDNAAPDSISGNMGGYNVFFTATTNNSDGLWFNSSAVDMDVVYPGDSLVVTATWSDWTENVTLPIKCIDTPPWLQIAVQLGSLATNGNLFKSSGTGPWNLTYSVTEKVTLNFNSLFNFSIPIPLVSGNYSLIPSVTLTYSETSSGVITLGGEFSLSPPSVNLGIVSLKLTAALTVTGKFSVSTDPNGSLNPVWVSASVGLSLTATVNASIPLYGFDILGVKVGFTLDISIAPSIALDLLLLPSTNASQDFIPGLGLMLSGLLGVFTLPLSIAIAFSIAIASVSIGGTASIALNFQIEPPPFALSGGWLNASFFVAASFLFFSTMWTFWMGSFPFGQGQEPARRLGVPVPAPYDNGSSAPWSLAPRYYNVTGYDQVVWSAHATQGTAVSDIYPNAGITAAPTAAGADLFFTNDQVNLPETNGLTVSGLNLNGADNSLTAIPSPPHPNFILARPQATHLPDGSLYVLWDGIPDSETGAAGPTALNQIELQGAHYYPSNSTWGPVHTWTSWGIADSYLVDATGGTPQVIALLSNVALPSDTSPERLVTFNLDSGTLLSNTSVVDLDALLAYRAGGGWVAAQTFDGNYSVVDVASGTDVAIPVGTPASGTLVSASFAAGSLSTLVLLYRTPTGMLANLVNLSSSTLIATVPLNQATTQVQALWSNGIYYLAAATPSGIETWSETGGTWTNLTSARVTDPTNLGLVQSGTSLLVYALLVSGPSTRPTKDLYLLEIGVVLPAVSSVAPGAAPTSAAPAPDYALFLGIAAAASVLILAGVAIWTHRRSRTPPPMAESAPAPGSPPPTG